MATEAANSMATETANSKSEELALLAEYKELLAEAILTGNKELVLSIKRRISILEAGLAREAKIINQSTSKV